MEFGDDEVILSKGGNNRTVQFLSSPFENVKNQTLTKYNSFACM